MKSKKKTDRRFIIRRNSDSHAYLCDVEEQYLWEPKHDAKVFHGNQEKEFKVLHKLAAFEIFKERIEDV